MKKVLPLVLILHLFMQSIYGQPVKDNDNALKEPLIVITGNVGDNGKPLSVKRNQYPMYNVNVYHGITVEQYKHMRQNGTLRTADASFMLARDAWKNDTLRAQNRYGYANELPPGNYFLIYFKDGVGKKKFKYLITEDLKKDIINGPDGQRNGFRIHNWSPYQSIGCLTTGISTSDKSVTELAEKVPTLEDKKSVHLIVEPRYAQYNNDKQLWEGKLR